MARDNEHNTDPNAHAARIVREAAGEADKLPDELEAAWKAWAASKSK